MQTRTARRGTLVLVLVLATLSAGRLTAKDGRDFAGFYDLTNVTDLGGTVQASFQVRIFNYSGSDVTGATVTLEDSLNPGREYGSFQAVSVQDRKSERLTHLMITIPRREYDRWQQGAPPHLHIQYQDLQGDMLRRMVELTKDFAPEVN